MALNVEELNATLNKNSNDYTKAVTEAEKCAVKWSNINLKKLRKDKKAWSHMMVIR